MVAVPVPAVQPVVPALLIVTGVAVVPAVVSVKGGVLVVAEFSGKLNLLLLLLPTRSLNSFRSLSHLVWWNSRNI